MDREIEEQLCALHAQLGVQRIALRALARAHPQPAALLDAWRTALAEAARCDPGAPPVWRHSETVADLTRAFAEHWTAELVDLAVPTDARSVSGPGVGRPSRLPRQQRTGRLIRTGVGKAGCSR